ncbi:MAG TPA: hypothetical protein VK165_11090 [Azonexus sp.]|nr:hypothetical protein [Azonexus sp.]
MAENNTSTVHDLVETDGYITMSAKRRGIAVDAACEIEQLCTIIKKALSDDADYMGVSGIVSRIKALNNCVVGAISDSIESTEQLVDKLAA